MSRTESEITTLRGSCLCGEVAYEIKTQLTHFYFCHCQQCRKLTGSAHASNILARPVPVNWLKGADKIKRFDARDGRAFTHVFCSECGSGLPFLNISGSTLFIPAGSLDTSPGLPVDRNIFSAEMPKWVSSGLNAKHCEGFPD